MVLITSLLQKRSHKGVGAAQQHAAADPRQGGSGYCIFIDSGLLGAPELGRWLFIKSARLSLRKFSTMLKSYHEKKTIY